MPELNEEQKKQLDNNIKSMLQNGASEEDVIAYSKDFNNKFLKKKVESTPSPLVLANSTSPSTGGGSVPQGINYLGGDKNVPQTTEQANLTTENVPAQPQPADKSLPSSMQIGADGQPVFTGISQPTNEPAPQLQAATSPLETTAKDQTNFDKNIVQKESLSPFTTGVAGLVSGVLKTPSFVYDLGASVNNIIAEKTGLEGLKAPMSSDITQMTGLHNVMAEDLDLAVKHHHDELARRYDKDLKTYFTSDKPGDLQKGLESLYNNVAEAIPTTIALAVSGGAFGAPATFAAGSAMFGAQKRSSLDESNPLMSEEKKVGISALSGAVESASESLFGAVKYLGKPLSGLFKSGGNKAVVEGAKEMIEQTYGKAFARYFGSAAEEVTTEVANQFAQNAIDKYSGVDPNRDLSQGVWDAAITAMAMSNAVGSPVLAGELASVKSSREQAKQNADQKAAIEQDIASPNVSDEAKKILSDKAKTINEADYKLTVEETNKYHSLTPENRSAADAINKKVQESEKALSDPNISDESRMYIEQDLNNLDDKLQKIYETNKTTKKETTVEGPAPFLTPGKNVDDRVGKTTTSTEVNTKGQEIVPLTPDEKDEFETLKAIEGSGLLSTEETSRLKELEQRNTVPVQQETPAVSSEKANNKTTETASVLNNDKPISESSPVIEEQSKTPELSKEVIAAAENKNTETPAVETTATPVENKPLPKTETNVRDEVILPPLPGRQMPMKMVKNDNGIWNLEIGGELTGVSPTVRKMAEEAFVQQSKTNATAKQEALDNELSIKRDDLQKTDVVSSSINVAPLFSQKIKNMEEANQLHATRFYKKYKQDVRDVAKEFGIEITEEQDGIGGFADLSEATTVFKVNGNFDDIVKMAAVVGSLTPEVQESTIASMYVKDGDENHNADQTELGISDKEAAIKAARDAGFESSGYTIVGDKISFLQIFNYPDLEFDKKLDIFDSKYKEYGGRIESTEKRAVRSEYLDSKRRKTIISEIEGSPIHERSSGSGFRDIIGKAKQRTDNYRKWKAIDSTHSAKRYKELRKKQIDLAAEGKKLPRLEKEEISKLEKYLAEPLASVIANDKPLYEEAKKDIDAITNKVSSIVEDGFSLKPDIKRPSRAAEKVIRWYDIQPNLLNDGARATIIVNNEHDADFVFNRIVDMYKVPGMRNPVNEKTFLGFQKRLIEIRAENGKIVEVQVTTPAVYLAKEGIDHFLPDNKKAAEDALNEVRKKVGFDIPEGGGHFFYEISRDENVQENIVKKANALSKKYYDLFFDDNFKMSESDFRKELSSFVKSVDDADKSNWDPSNKGKVPTPIREFLKETPKTNNNATTERNVTESDQRKHQEGDARRKATETSDSNRNVESRKKQAEQQQEEVVNEEPKKKAPTNELIDEEDLADEGVVDDKAVVDKFMQDIEIFKTVENQEAKFTGMLSRLYKAKEDGKIKKTTYTAIRNTMKSQLSEKYRREMNKEDAKIKVSAVMEKVKTKLLGEGYKNIVLSSVSPITPKTIADLIDLTTKLIHRGIDAGYSIAEATTKAMSAIKNVPAYKKLVDNEELNGPEFEKMVNTAIASKLKGTKESMKNPDVNGGTKERKTATRMKEAGRFTDIIDEMGNDATNYESLNLKKVNDHIDGVLREIETNGMMEDLAIEMTKGKNPFYAPIQNVAAGKVVDRLRVLAEKEGNSMQKNALNKLAAELATARMKDVTVNAQSTAMEAILAESMPLSKEGITDHISAAMSNVQDTHLDEKQKSDISSVQKDIKSLLLEPEAQKAIEEAVNEKLNDIAEKLKGKEWVSEFDAEMDNLKIDLSDC